MSLAGKTVVIFGGSSGMGKACAKSVLAVGGTPFIVGRTEAKLATARTEIAPSAPASVRVGVCDVADEASLEQFWGGIDSGSVHHLVATLGDSAGCSDIRGPAGLKGLKKQFDFKFFGQVAAVSYGADKLADGGSIVLTSGALSRRPGAGSTALAAANAALDAIVKGLANDLGPRLRVNCVSPGLTNTEMWAGMTAEQREGMLSGFASRLPLKRAGESEDVGAAILFLLTATYTTGTTLDVDGGATIRP